MEIIVRQSGKRQNDLRPEKVFPRICLPKFWAKFG